MACPQNSKTLIIFGFLQFIICVILTGNIFEPMSPNNAFARKRRRPPRRKRQRKARDGRRSPTSGDPATKALVEGEWEFNECLLVPPGKKVRIRLEPDSTIHDLTAWISGMTCRRFIVGSNIRAQNVTIHSPVPVTPREAYRAFVSALNVMGLTIQRSGGYLKIVDSKKSGLSTVCPPGKPCPKDDRIVTRLFRLKHIDPNDIKGVLDGLKSQNGSIIIYEPTSLVIITDTASVAGRLAGVIRRLDIESEGDRIWIVRIRHAEASEIAGLLSEVFDIGQKKPVKQKRTRRPRRGRRPPRKQPQRAEDTTGVNISILLADDRTNILVLGADEESYLKARALIHKLDIPLDLGQDRIHVVPLANANAEDLQDTLSNLAGGPQGRTARQRRGVRRRTPQRGQTPGKTGPFKGEVQITADSSTNSLVVVASMKDFLSLERIVKELDVPRKQVFIEASIVEVSLSKSRELGTAFHGGAPVGSGENESLLLFGHDASKSIMIDPGSLTGLAAGLRGPELKDAESLLGIPGISFPSFAAFFNALQRNDDVNIVSQPHILTTDNEEAVIEVGENVPFQAGISGMGALGALAGQQDAERSPGASALGALPMMSIQRQDVTLKLTIVPHINEADHVRLEIEGEMNEVKSIDPSMGPTTAKKKIRTSIVVKDQQTAVLGGLISAKTKKNVTKTPVLGDIPILGWLFKKTVQVEEKTNLLVFLTPYIIYDQTDFRRIFGRKMEERREFIERHTLFDDYDIEAEIDYQRTRGLLAEINRVAMMAEEDLERRRQAMEESKFKDVDGPVLIRDEDRKDIATK